VPKLYCFENDKRDPVRLQYHIPIYDTRTMSQIINILK